MSHIQTLRSNDKLDELLKALGIEPGLFWARVAVLRWLGPTQSDDVKTPHLLAAEINALPQRVRDYIHHLETDADPAGDKWRLAAAEENLAALTVHMASIGAKGGKKKGPTKKRGGANHYRDMA